MCGLGGLLRSKQLHTPVTFESTDLMQRSLFGLARCYNALPQRLVDIGSVKGFQKALQDGLLRLAEQGAPDWQTLYSTAWKRFRRRAKLDELFH